MLTPLYLAHVCRLGGERETAGDREGERERAASADRFLQRVQTGGLSASCAVFSPSVCSQGASDDFIDANIQLALRLAQQLKESKGLTSKLVSAPSRGSGGACHAAEQSACSGHSVCCCGKAWPIHSVELCASLAGSTGPGGGSTGGQKVQECTSAGETMPAESRADHHDVEAAPSLVEKQLLVLPPLPSACALAWEDDHPFDSQEQRFVRALSVCPVQTEGITLGSLEDGGAPKGFFGQLRTAFDFDLDFEAKEEAEKWASTAPADVYIVANVTTTELPGVQAYVVCRTLYGIAMGLTLMFPH